jgi:drug/metabolite transporter (DMT)-like permease
VRHFYTWTGIVAVVVCSTLGDVLISHAMKSIGDIAHVWRDYGTFYTVRRLIGNAALWLGILFMALGFFSLLFALSWADLSLVGPASASLTFLTNAIAAKFFLKENVDRRRWFAALMVACGVVLIAH